MPQISFRKIALTFFGALIICSSLAGQIDQIQSSPTVISAPLIKGLHTLSIHVRDTITHDSVFKFLINQLMLPVYYHPVKYRQTRYVGVYAGNMVLEPCGPYSYINYAMDNFRAIFFGMNFEVFESLAEGKRGLEARDIKHQVNKGSIYIRDSVLCNENLFAALYEVPDREKRDSLRLLLINQKKESPGIEYISEISIGYKEEVNLLKWKEFLHPYEFDENNICRINDSLQIHFSQEHFNQVKGITFKVQSLLQTKEFLLDRKLKIIQSDDKILLDPVLAYGLSVYFKETLMSRVRKFRTKTNSGKLF